MKYLTHVGSVYQPKNALDRAVQDVIKKLNRMIIDAEQVEEFKKTLQEVVKQLNTAHPRCTALSLSWHGGLAYEQHDWFISLGDRSLIFLNLYSFKEQAGAEIVFNPQEYKLAMERELHHEN